MEMTALEIKRRVKAEEWAIRVQECRSSGKPVQAWCKEHEVCVGTYYKWERTLLAMAKEEGRELSARAEFVEVRGGEERAGVGELIASVKIGKGSLQLYRGANAAVVKALIEGLGRAK